MKEIKGKILQTVQSDSAQHVSRTEEMLSMVGRKMTYADLMSMAEKEDERLILQAKNGKHKEQAKIWFNRGSQNTENQKVFSHICRRVIRKIFRLLVRCLSLNNASKHRENSPINHVDIILDSLEHLVKMAATKVSLQLMRSCWS